MAYEIADIDALAPDASARRHSENELNNYLLDHRYSDAMQVPLDELLLTYNGVPIGNRGNIVAINGKAKSRKSVIASAMMSAFYRGDDFLGFRNVGNKPRRVLHIDTEQGLGHYIKSVRRVLHDAGLSQAPDNFFSYHCRDAEVPFRLEFVDFLLRLHEPDVVVIDGITDLIFDINSQEEATRLGQHLMTWTSRHKCLAIVVIHVTKGNNNMTGAIGTYIEKKCQTAIHVDKPVETPELSDISCQFARDEGFKTFGIQFDSQLNHYVRVDETLYENKGKGGDYSPHACSPAFRADLLNTIFRLKTIFATANDFRGALQTHLTKSAKASQKPAIITQWISYYTDETKEVLITPEGLIRDSLAKRNEAKQPKIFDAEPPPDEHEETGMPAFDIQLSDSDDLPF